MKPYTLAAALLLGMIALIQGLRAALAWPVTVNGFPIPVWASVVACVVIAWITVMLWREHRR